MYASRKPHTEVRVSSEEKKRNLKNYVNLYWRLHVCVTTKCLEGWGSTHGDARTWICSPAAFVPSHRRFWDKGTALLDGNCLSGASTGASALARRTRRIPPDPPQAAVEAPAPQEPSNRPLGKDFPTPGRLKSLPAGAFTCCSAARGGARNKWLPGSPSAGLGHLGARARVPLFLCCAGGSGNGSGASRGAAAPAPRSSLANAFCLGAALRQPRPSPPSQPASS